MRTAPGALGDPVGRQVLLCYYSGGGEGGGRGTCFGRRSTSFSHELGYAFQIFCRWSLVGSIVDVPARPGVGRVLYVAIVFVPIEEIVVGFRRHGARQRCRELFRDAADARVN